MREPRALVQVQVELACKPGKGQVTCSWLTFGPDGWACAKGSDLAPMIEQKRATGDIRAMGDNCSGYPDWRLTP